MIQPQHKYKPFPPVDMPERRWPSRAITKAPVWLSTDLRDGNQAIFNPMDGPAKLDFFRMLTRLGIKEIEVGFPSASETEFNFVRELIEGGHIPPDVTIQVLTQARPELIERTMESVKGAKQAIVHVYTATSPTFRDVVFHMSKEEVAAMAVRGVGQIKKLADLQPKTAFRLEYSPETFSETELPYALEICDAVTEAWGASPDNKVILNLPATVEACTPNIFADRVEWMDRRLKNRDGVILSLHTHNDRGTAVAAAELGLMAGADRVEGCLFGNGERTGNADLVTLALNLHTQGIPSGLDFSNIDDIARAVERCTQIPVHPRHPYAGELVHTAFSGGHQDAIKKGMACRGDSSYWCVPYLSIAPQDIGRKYESIIRVNSQSGKGGIAYVLESSHGIAMPRRLQIEFSGVVQKYAEATGEEVGAGQIWTLFKNEYLCRDKPIRYVRHELFAQEKGQGIRLDFECCGKQVTVRGGGNGAIDATIKALRLPVGILSYSEQSMGQGSDAKAVAFLEMTVEDAPGACYGVGIHENFVTASILAVIGGVNRMAAHRKLKIPPEGCVLA